MNLPLQHRWLVTSTGKTLVPLEYTPPVNSRKEKSRRMRERHNTLWAMLYSIHREIRERYRGSQLRCWSSY